MTTLPLQASTCIALFETAPNATWSQQSGTKSVAALPSRVGNYVALQTGATSIKPTLNIDTSNKLRGHTELDFDGTQFLACNDIASTLNDTSFSMATVARCSDPTAAGPFALFSMAHSSGTSKFELYASSTDIHFTITNAAGSGSTADGGITLDDAAHCYTVLFDKGAGTLKVRQDAVQIINITGLSGTYTVDRFSIGALTTSTTSAQFKGTIGPVAMYLGASGLKLVEDALGAKLVSGAFAF